MTLQKAFMPQRTGIRVGAGIGTSASWEHVTDVVRDTEGNVISHRLVCRKMDIAYPIPQPLPVAQACITGKCIKEYKKQLDEWLSTYKRELDYVEILSLYDKARTEYVYRHRNDDIDEKYRTGDPFPSSIMEALKEIAKLKLKGGRKWLKYK